jgi:altronate dehydratase small subunit
MSGGGATAKYRGSASVPAIDSAPAHGLELDCFASLPRHDPPPVKDPRLLLLSPDDNVCAATGALAAGEEICFGDDVLRLSDDVPVGHKVAVRAIAVGEKVLKWGASIGSASRPIAAGDHVHSHNLASDYLPSAGRAPATGGS